MLNADSVPSERRWSLVEEGLALGFTPELESLLLHLLSR